MFGVLASGRLPNTAVTQLSESGFLLQLEGASAINHLSVFMTGTVPFSDGFGGSIHLGWPSPDGSEPPWQYLGFISNEKPSAVFRINKTDPGSVRKEALNLTGATLPLNTSESTALIAISVEPLSVISEKEPNASSQPITVDYQTQFVTNMLESFSNHVMSYEVSTSDIHAADSQMYIPSKAVKSWMEKYQRQLTYNAMFSSK